MAGTIAAIGGNNKGVKGVIRNGLVKIHAVRVFATGSTPTSTVIAGFEDCVEAEANVITMSLGGTDPTEAFQDAIVDAHKKGILVFASAGNTGRRAKRYPASYKRVTSVGSITESYVKSDFSTFNNAVDLVGPGSEVLSTVPGNGTEYEYKSGTSMACPHVSGVAALVWSNFPTLPANTILSTLEDTAFDLPLEYQDGKDEYYGHGLVQAKAAYDALMRLSSPTVSPAPSSMPVEYCADGLVVQVDVQADFYSFMDQYWEITDVEGSIVASQSEFFGFYQFTSRTYCLDKTETCDGTDYTFTIYDLFEDGMCNYYGDGYYKVYVDGDLYVEGCDFKDAESTSLCEANPCAFIGGKQVCTNEPGCYWDGNTKSCTSCSEIPGLKKCNRIDACTWNDSGFCE